MIRLLSIVLVLASMTTRVIGEASASTHPSVVRDSVRVAVISTADTADLAALVAAELSGNRNLVLLERDDLAKIGDEAKVQQLASSDAFALGKLVGADGLISLGKTPTGIEVRIIAVSLGYALFDDQISPDQNPDKMAKSIAHLVSGYAPKLKLDPAKAVPISVLNLRADYGTQQSEALERNLTLLLESRLTSIPEYVVLERRHAWSLGFEHTLTPSAKPLLRGAYLIDGTVSIPPNAPGDCTIAARVRSPNGKDVAVSAKGAVDNLSSLADQLIAGIQAAVGRTVSQPAEAPVQEAQEYLGEALWGWRSGVPDAALEAVDSADLLGAVPENVVPLRIQILCSIADEGMENWYPQSTSNDPAFDANSLATRADAMLRAIQETVRYRDQKLESKLGEFVPSNGGERLRFRTSQTITTVAYMASKVLLLLERANSPRADELRHALRSITNYDPLNGKKGGVERSNAGFSGDVADMFAGDWAQTLEEELAWLRLICVDTQQVLPRNVLRDPTQTFCARFLKTPEEREKAFDNFVESLKDMPQSKRTYFVLKTHEKDPAIADAAYLDYLAYIWPFRDEIATTENYSPLPESVWSIAPAVVDRNPKAALPLIHTVLDAERPGQASIIVLKNLWKPAETDAADAANIWKEENDYVKRRTNVVMETKGRPDASFTAEMDSVMYYFREKFPAIVNAPAPESPALIAPLVVTKFWEPWQVTTTPKYSFMINTCDVSPDGIWVGGLQHGIPVHGELFHVDLTNFTSEAVPLPDDKMPMQIKSTPDALYMIYDPLEKAGKHSLARYDLKTSSWQSRPLQDFFDGRLCEAGGSLYLFITMKFGWNETSIVRYDWDADKWNILASSRRRPARNQFDDAAPIVFFEGIFTGPNHQPCLTLENGTFYIREDEGKWPEVFDGGFASRALTIGDRTLVYNYGGEAVMLNAEKASPEYWTANSAPHVRKPAVNGKPPDKVPTPWASQARWNLSVEKQSPWKNGVGFHDEDLFILQPPGTRRSVSTSLLHGK